ncbi:MAG TPA: hypothetical protein VM095_13920 [Pyrinomonadaceae bacterium]|nr:hypothetical protein [Pyrinomonadaceae bacterium]
MKTLFLIAVLSITALSFGGAKPADYSGNWTLDMKQSKNLPKYYERIQSHKLNITQDEKLLNVRVEIGREQNEPEKIDLAYNLDGSETKTEMKIRTQDGLLSVPTTLKAVVKDEGKLEIIITREVPMPDKTFKGITVEDWELSVDGKTLTIHKTDTAPWGTMESEMVFVRA